MYTDKDKEMVIKYLQRHYPISRVKIDNKFKRAIVLNNGETYQLNNKANHNNLKTLYHFHKINQLIFPLVK
jgi:hypothetical protein